MTTCQTSFKLTSETMLPDLLGRHPETRGVFDRYGLSGCGGALGPHETIRFFARAHGVGEAQLLDELAAAIAAGEAGESIPEPAGPSPADTIYRRFFLAGILTALTAGAGWGVWLLWRIGFAGDFTAISIHHVNAHGHAQIFGWVGLFIMGFGYQALPRLWHTPLAAPRLAVAAFVAMLVGIIAQTAGLTAPGQPWALAAATTGGALEVLAITAFAGQIITTFLRSRARLAPYVGFAVVALTFFVLQSILSLWHGWRTMTTPDREALLWQVATWQAPLRDLQIHGMAMLMIIGVSLRMLPAFFRLPEVPARRAWAGLAILTLSVIGEAGLFVLWRLSGINALAGLLMLPWLGLAAGVALLVWPWRLWRPLLSVEGGRDRTTKFIRAGWGWLAVSLVMMLLLPLHQLASGIGFSHAYYGAIRHAITVGFISLMIMGFAAKVVPTLNGVDPRRLTSLWLPFALVNLGCLLRVSLQALTDWFPSVFMLVGISGVLELAGLTIWGWGLAVIMLAGRRAETLSAMPSPSPAAIEPTHHVGEVVEWFPATLPVFERFGFGAVRNPVLLRTVARRVTLAHAAAMHSVPLDRLLAELNLAIGAPAPAACEACASRTGCLP